jgi:hypothetical protein
MSGQEYWDEKNAETDDFGRDCVKQMRAMTVKGAHEFLVCLDGSESSDLAFRSTLNLRRKFDRCTAFHCFKGTSMPVWCCGLM